jgi:hypothetical protein
MSGSDKRKQSLYFPEEMLKEIAEEAARQEPPGWLPSRMRYAIANGKRRST